MLELLTSEGVGVGLVVIGADYFFQAIKIIVHLLGVVSDRQTIAENRLQLLQLAEPPFLLHGRQSHRIRDHLA